MHRFVSAAALLAFLSACTTHNSVAIHSAPQNLSVPIAERLFAEGRANEALTLLRDATQRHEPAAEAKLAALHMTGSHVVKDLGEAERLLRSALRDPQPSYQRLLACVLHYRDGDPQESTALLKGAAAAGDILAAAYLSRSYRLGLGQPVNISLADFTLIEALSRLHRPPAPVDDISAFLREHIPLALAEGICGPRDDTGALLATAFPRRYVEWRSGVKRDNSNPILVYP